WRPVARDGRDARPRARGDSWTADSAPHRGGRYPRRVGEGHRAAPAPDPPSRRARADDRRRMGICRATAAPASHAAAGIARAVWRVDDRDSSAGAELRQLSPPAHGARTAAAVVQLVLDG